MTPNNELKLSYKNITWTDKYTNKYRLYQSSKCIMKKEGCDKKNRTPEQTNKEKYSDLNAILINIDFISPQNVSWKKKGVIKRKGYKKIPNNNSRKK